MKTPRILLAVCLVACAAALPAPARERAPVTVTLVRWPYT